MIDRPAAIRVLGEVEAGAKEALRRTLRHCYSSFDTYSGPFRAAGVSEAEIDRLDPLSVLQRLPLLDADTFQRLTDESLEAGDQIVDMETSSGTTGTRKRRFISSSDDATETDLLVQLFRSCGITASDRVACLDTDPLTLMVSFTKALDRLGVSEAYTICVGTDFTQALARLPLLDPTVVIAVPSVIERCYDALVDAYDRAGRGDEAGVPGRIQKLVYAGEPLSERTRASLESVLGLEVFGYYGASETSALGIECAAHDGMHLFSDWNLFEVREYGQDDDGLRGELLVTSLRQATLPLLRYPLGDIVRTRPGACRCGLAYPRVEVAGRLGDGFSVLGAKLNFLPILDAVYEEQDEPGQMQLVLSRDQRETITIILPRPLLTEEEMIRRRLLKDQPDLDFLVRSGFLTLELSFVDETYFSDARKVRRVVDDRLSVAQ